MARRTNTYTIRLDPWAAEYDGAIQVGEAEPVDGVDLRSEREEWAAVRPVEARPPGRLAFVDGVRRIEHRLLIGSGDKTHFGLLGTFATGAVIVDGRAQVCNEAVGRMLSVGGGLAVEALEAAIPHGRGSLVFRPRVVPENTPEAAVQGLQNGMREAEALLAAALADEVELVLLDGPLTYLAGRPLRVVGYVKRLLQAYLPAAEAALLPSLAPGERTPLFLIRGLRHERYSWYARIAHGRAIQAALTGVVRLETSSSLDLLTAVELADASTRELPRFASAAGRDPRAPQNLYPIGGLEDALRRLMGDSGLVRRAVEAHLHREAAA